MIFVYETKRLILKVLKPDSAGQVLDFYLRDRELYEKYEPDRLPNFYTNAFQKQTLIYEYNMAVKGNLLRYYVYEKENPDIIIGTISFQHIIRGYFSSCELGYKFSESAHHKGYATEAISFLAAQIFDDMNLHRIVARVLPENEASLKLLKRLGFTHEGCVRGYLYMGGRWRDHEQYSLLKEDEASSQPARQSPPHRS